MKKLFKIIPYLCFLLIMSSCCKKEPNLPAPHTSNSVTTTLTGTVVDESNNPVDAVTVTAYGKTTTTDNHGFFAIKNVAVSPDRAYVKATKSGYFTGSKACKPAANSATQVRITLSSNVPNFSLTTSAGGTATLANGSSVELPVDAVVSANGSAYSGNIQLAVKHLDPSSSDFDNLMPGDLEAIRTDGSSASLFSYGMLNVELTDNAGQPLKLASGKSATLTFPVPASMQGNAPATIPLWHFDETAGIWKEEGSATLVGTNYVGQVSHFSTWNCDQAAFGTTVTGKVLDCNGTPIPGITVLVGQTPALTNSEGIYSAFIQAGITFEVSVPSNENYGVTGTPNSAGPFPAQQTNSLPDLNVTCPALLTGSLVDCNNSPTGGMIIVSWTGGSNSVVTSANGSFKIPVLANQAVSVFAYSYDGFKSTSTNLTSPSSGNSSALGQIAVCSGTTALNTTFTISGGIYNNTNFIINEQGANSIYYTSSGRTSIYIYDQAAYNLFSCNFIGNTIGTYSPSPSTFQYISLNLANGSVVSDSSALSNIPFTITKYEAVGGVIEGTYAGTFYNQANGLTYTITNGRFAIIRGNDQ